MKFFILLVTSILLSTSFGTVSNNENLCLRWMDMGYGEFYTKKSVIDNCDNQSFKVLNYEFAKDKNFVYYKPMPNANNMTIIVEQFDSKTFTLSPICSSYAKDKNHIYHYGKTAKKDDPQASYCFDFLAILKYKIELIKVNGIQDFESLFSF